MVRNSHRDAEAEERISTEGDDAHGWLLSEGVLGSQLVESGEHPVGRPIAAAHHQPIVRSLQPPLEPE
jgi:hypothetical protein